MEIRSSTPSKVMACPTLPGAKAAPFWRVAWLVPMESMGSPSPRHHAMRPAGAGAQFSFSGGETMRFMGGRANGWVNELLSLAEMFRVALLAPTGILSRAVALLEVGTTDTVTGGLLFSW